MNKLNQFDEKRKLKQRQDENNNDDDEQIEKTLNFLDSILDQYLTEQDIIPENQIRKSSRIKSSSDIQQDGTISNHTNTSSSSSSSPRYIAAPQFRHPFERTSHVRRHTSETSLHQIPSSSKPNITRSRPLQTNATSTEDLSTIPSQKHLSNFIKKSDQHLSPNVTTASLIDLSSFDKLSSRPRFRFVPPSNDNHTLKEVPEIEREFHLKTIPSNQTSFNQQTKPSHQIVKPTVIIPSVPKSAPIIRPTETHIHYQNGNSAFKPHRSSGTGVSSKIQQIKRTESIQKPNLHVGITNSDNRPFLRQAKSIPQYHQSMLNLSSPEPVRTNRLVPQTSYPSNEYHSPRPLIHKESISRWIQQVNNTSSINGLVHSQQQTYPYGSYISTTTDMSPPMNNNHREQRYFNPINVPKSHPVQSVYPVATPVVRNGVFALPSSSSNVYNFNQNHSPRKGQSRRHQHRENGMITTYL